MYWILAAFIMFYVFGFLLMCFWQSESDSWKGKDIPRYEKIIARIFWWAVGICIAELYLIEFIERKLNNADENNNR